MFCTDGQKHGFRFRSSWPDLLAPGGGQQPIEGVPIPSDLLPDEERRPRHGQEGENAAPLRRPGRKRRHRRSTHRKRRGRQRSGNPTIVFYGLALFLPYNVFTVLLISRIFWTRHLRH